MSYKNWVIYSVFTVLSILVFIALINYAVDPLQQFRISSFFPVELKHSEARYLNPGIARHYDYDSVVIGTSHAKNFSLAELDKKLFFSNPVKLTIPGGRAYEINQVLRIAFKHKIPNKVFFVLDVGSFDGLPTRKHASFQEYLYADGLRNTLVYLLKFDTTKRSMLAIFSMLKGERYNKEIYADMYVKWKTKSDNVKKIKQTTYKRPYQLDVLKDSFEQNILWHIRENPKTEFTIIHPPYSILAFIDLSDSKSLVDVLLFKKYLIEATSSYDNVAIYDFQIAKDITHKLDNYVDITHYYHDVNSQIIDLIKSEQYRVNLANVDDINNELAKQVENYLVKEDPN